jgi:protein-disulfide isomerase
MTSRAIVAFVLGAAVSAAVAAAMWPHMPIGEERLRTVLLNAPEFLADRPEILGAADRVLQNRALASQGAERAQLIDTQWQHLLHVAFTPTLGSLDAPLVLLEFTDYTCEPCRASTRAIEQVLHESADVRVAVLLLPIGGALSEYAARVALAAYRQKPDRFAELHRRLLESEGQFSQQVILDALRDLGFDVEQVEREAASAESRRYFDQVRTLAEDLRISGVPAFAMNEQLLLGGVTYEQLSELVGTARVQSSTGNTPLTVRAVAQP